ncbi:LTA synthase family protein [Clostridium hydrogeniformans]|uniref:LTA synthase family protein n=1 Tax=Clostridium hydrogeniformans TaxID=349933 RepID=UPI00047F9EAB|nr:LTA synthase family protein [Clostridium hydrogeniformans]
MNKVKEIFNNTKVNLRYDIIFWFTTLMILIKQIVFFKLYVSGYSWQMTFLYFGKRTEWIVYLCYTLLLTSIGYLFSKSRRIISLLVINLLTSIYIIWSIMKCVATSSYFSLPIAYDYVPWDMINTILSKFNFKYLVFIADVVIIALFLILTKNRYKNCKRSICSFVIIAALSSSYLGYAHYKLDKKEKGGYSQSVYVDSWTDGDRHYALGVIGHGITKIYNSIKTKPIDLSNEQNTDISNMYKKKEENFHKNFYFGKLRGNNIIMLQLESFETLVLNQKVNGVEITPNLNKLLKNSIYFDNIYPNNNFGVSSDCDFMIHTGLYPNRTGQTFFDHPNNRYPNSLPFLLKENGYSTAAYHSDKGYMWNMYENLPKFGFDEVSQSGDYTKEEPFNFGVVDHEFLPQVADKVSKMPKPFYALSVTVSGHSPFRLNEKYKELNLPDNLKDNIIGDFFQVSRYTDTAIGNFIKKLEDLNLLDNTTILIYGDHGGIHRYHNDDLKKIESPKDWWFSDEKIPLIVYNKNISGEVNHTYGGQIDFYPTLTYLLGIENEKYTKFNMGKNLFNTKNNYVNVNGKLYGEFNEEINASEKKVLDLNELILRSNYINKNFVR